MGRKKINFNKHKCKISITILPEMNDMLEKRMINKSKLINSLLYEYLNQFTNEKNNLD